MPKQRLDERLLETEAARDACDAFVIVTEGRVFVNGQKAIAPGQLISDTDAVEVHKPREYVGRGAYKLEAALERFSVKVTGKICTDIGAATGGFTEVLLKHGAKKVYAIDAGRGKLDLKLRQDLRVITLEETNALTMPPPAEAIDAVTIDVSFTSLRLILPKIVAWLSEKGSVIALFKPQYEIKDKSKLRHGIVEDADVREEAIRDFRSWLRENGWLELGFMESPIRGGEGNVEYLFHLQPA